MGGFCAQDHLIHWVCSFVLACFFVLFLSGLLSGAYDSENRTYQSMWAAAEVVLGGQFTELNAHVRNKQRTQINHLGP